MVRIAALSAIVAIVAGLAVTWFLGRSGGDQFAQCSASSVAGGEIGGPFELINQHGDAVTDKDVLSEPALVYFGYTYCPDVCPFDVSRNADAIDIMAANGVTALLDADDSVTPTPAVSVAILSHNKGRTEGLADGIVITPSHNPPSDGGFKYNPPHGGPAGGDVTSKIQARANAYLEARLDGVKRVSDAA